ncbi:MAG: VWA domain-containing protein [Acidobacteriaceae bacterium]|nr:VWA domain-containing protein [Acidobacteriaceae bacterium]
MAGYASHALWMAALAAAWCGAQEPPGGAYTISDNVNLVVLDVGVRNSSGGFVSGLQKDNFRVFEDHSARQITQFASQDIPVTIGLVVDNSGSMLRKRAEVVTAGLAFAKQSNPRDDFFIVNFNNSVVRGLPAHMLFTDNLQDLRRALNYRTPMGQTALYDAIAYSLQHLEYSRQERRALIVVSDGGDNVSKTRLPELMRLIQASRATVYTVGLFDAQARDLNPRVLRRFAAASGGEYFEPTLDSVVPVFDKISRDIRNRYTLAFIPGAQDKRTVRDVKVIAEQNGRKLSVRARTTFTIAPLSELLARQ